MFTVKIFRNGTRSPTRVEFYSTPTPHVDTIEDGGKATHEIEVAIEGPSQKVPIFEGDAMFIENEIGTTLFSVR